jgi:endonuclease/exonuclease/phosphatase (EEP) superfamily protein YafD
MDSEPAEQQELNDTPPAHAEAAPAGPGGIARGTAALLSLATWGYLAALVVLLILLEWWSEAHWTLDLLLYGPSQGLLLPLALLTPLALLLRRRLLWVHLLCIALVAFLFMTFGWRSRTIASAETITVVTHNVGDGNVAQFNRFVADEKPDVLLLQDAGLRHREIARTYASWFRAQHGGLVLVSKHPIIESALLRDAAWNGRSVAARFVIQFQGRPLALYNVHLPTPRAQLSPFLQKRVLSSLFLDDERAAANTAATTYQQYLTARAGVVRRLVKVFADEKQPCIVGGDFNLPDHGTLYHVLTDDLKDAFAETGRGWGLTFPGARRNRGARFIGPWLRIDYLFAGKGWVPISCDVEPGQDSQHRAVVGRFNPSR